MVAAPTPIGEAEIVIAAQNIARGKLIPPEGGDHFTVPGGPTRLRRCWTNPGQVIGKRARMDIARGVPITENMITDQAGDLLPVGSDASIAIPEGFTAIAMPMDRFSGVAFAIREGDQVDVLVSLLLVDLDTEFQSELPNEGMFLFSPEGELLNAISCRLIETNEAGELVCAAGERPPVVGLLQFDDISGQDFFAGPSGPQRPPSGETSA